MGIYPSTLFKHGLIIHFTSLLPLLIYHNLNCPKLNPLWTCCPPSVSPSCFIPVRPWLPLSTLSPCLLSEHICSPRNMPCCQLVYMLLWFLVVFCFLNLPLSCLVFCLSFSHFPFSLGSCSLGSGQDFH